MIFLGLPNRNARILMTSLTGSVQNKKYDASSLETLLIKVQQYVYSPGGGGGGGGTPLYQVYVGMCRPKGYGF